MSFSKKNFMSDISESWKARNLYKYLFYTFSVVTSTPIEERIPTSPCSTPCTIVFKLWRSCLGRWSEFANWLIVSDSEIDVSSCSIKNIHLDGPRLGLVYLQDYPRVRWRPAGPRPAVWDCCGPGDRTESQDNSCHGCPVEIAGIRPSPQQAAAALNWIIRKDFGWFLYKE